MRRLTAKVGCSAMAPYRYFADKEALIASIRAQAFRRLADTLDEVSSAGRDEAADVGEAYVRFARAQPGTYKLMFDQIGRASCRERVCQYVKISGVDVPLKKKKHEKRR